MTPATFVTPDGAAPNRDATREFQPLFPAEKPISERLREAYEQGYNAGTEEMTARLHDTNLRHDRELAEAVASARNALLETFAHEIVAPFEKAIESLAADIETDLANMLVPMIDDHLRQQAVADLGRHLREWQSGSASVQVLIEGPSALVQELRRDLPHNWHVQIKENDADFDVVVRVDKTILSTRLRLFAEDFGIGSP